MPEGSEANKELSPVSRQSSQCCLSPLRAVHDIARGDRAPLRVAGGAVDAETDGVADGLFAPLRLDSPLGDKQLRGTAGLLLEAHGDPRHLVEAGLKCLHKV